jgi:hypothetical protein
VIDRSQHVVADYLVELAGAGASRPADVTGSFPDGDDVTWTAQDHGRTRITPTESRRTVQPRQHGRPGDGKAIGRTNAKTWPGSGRFPSQQRRKARLNVDLTHGKHVRTFDRLAALPPRLATANAGDELPPVPRTAPESV